MKITVHKMFVNAAVVLGCQKAMELLRHHIGYLKKGHQIVFEMVVLLLAVWLLYRMCPESELEDKRA